MALVTNEPSPYSLVGPGTFAFLPSLGMRLAPEVLVQELYREVFFEKWSSDEGKEMQLSPDNEWPAGSALFNDEEKALLYAGRGRSKRKGAKGTKDFYAPLFPRLARGGWPRRQSEHIIREFLLHGPVAQHLRWRGGAAGPEVDNFASGLVAALAGSRGTPSGNPPELLSSVLDRLPPPNVLASQMDVLGNEKATARLASEIRTIAAENLLQYGIADRLAERIFDDLQAVIGLEKSVPRLQWLEVLKCYLRVGLASWALARTRITVLLRDWLMDALSDGPVPSEPKLHALLHRRYRDLFHPTLTPTGELGQHVDQYVVARVELNLLLDRLDKVTGGKLSGKQLTTSKKGSDAVSIEELLQLASSHRDAFSREIGSITPRQFATREGEAFPAWGTPRKRGVGKNLDEFLLVLRPGGEGDADRGYLVCSAGVGVSGHVVFPGSTLIKTFAFLAEQKRRALGSGQKLILADLEDHFESYGIAFRSALAARPRLIQELIVLGLLKGSPDAGDSAELRSPY